MSWLLAHRLRIIAITVPLIVIAGGAAAVFATRSEGDPKRTPPASDSPTSTPSTVTVSTIAVPTPTATVLSYAGLLDGVAMTASEWAARKDLPSLAIMIDNSPGGYPHSGLDRADVIYEALVEGGLTRLMAVFWRQEADLVQPVRSARTPFVIWVSELGALYGHAGSADTYNDANSGGQIFEWGIQDLNAFSPGSDVAYYRDDARYAPHNLSTTTVRLRKAATSLGFTKAPALAPWRYKSPGPSSASLPAALGIEVNFSERRELSRVVQYHWDAAAGRYLRFAVGGPDIDAVTKKQLGAANVIVMRIPWRVLDSGHVIYEQYGEGPVQVFLDGKVIHGTWKKADRSARTRFYDQDGNEIGLNRGPTIIAAAGPLSLITVAARVADLPEFPYYTNYTSTVPFANNEDDFDPNPAPTRTPSPSPSATGSKTPAPSASPSGTARTSTPAGTSTLFGSVIAVTPLPSPSATAKPPTAIATSPATTTASASP